MKEREKTRRLYGLAGVLSVFLMVGSSLSAQEGDEPLLVPLTDVSLNKLPYIVAKQTGLFEKYGLNIELYITPGAAEKGSGDGMDPNPQYVKDVKSERLLSTGGGVGLINNRLEKGGDRIVIGSTDHELRWFVYARPGIRSLEDLKGKRISATHNSSCTGGIVNLIADRMGWEIGKDVTLITNHVERVDKLGRGEYDAVIVTELPHVYAQSQGLYPLVDLRDWDLPYICSGISASRSWLSQGDNRETAKNFLKAVVEATAMMKEDRSVVYDALEEWYGVRDVETKQKMYETVGDLVDRPYPSVDGIKLIMETYDSPEMRKYSPEDFYDDSLMREIDESGFVDEVMAN